MKQAHGFTAMLVGLCLSLLVFFVCAFSAAYLRRHHAFDQENIIFDADPYYRSFAFAEGWGERSLMHPNLSNFVNPFVRVGERLLRPFSPGVAPSELRMRLSLGISPLFAALTTALIFWLAAHNQVSVLKALSLSSLFGLSMSTVAFGSVPDHFLISAFFCALGVLLIQLDARFSSRVRFVLWTLLITATAGITLSNAVPLIALFGLAQWIRQPDWSKVARVMLLAGIACAVLTVVSWASLNWLYGDFSSVKADQAYNRNVGRVMFYITDNPLRDFVSFPITLGRAFWAGKPDLDRNPPYPNPAIAKYNRAFGYQPPLKQAWSTSALQLIPLPLVMLSLWAAWMRDRKQSIVIACAATVFLLFNWALHSVWGGGAEIFLFSPHWHFASVLALIPLARLWPARLGDFIFLTVAIIVSAVNLLVWHDALKLLPTLALG
jgi:4-amino-4-deoxy-L-arabinose transferase-like glycosyltransferase